MPGQVNPNVPAWPDHQGQAGSTEPRGTVTAVSHALLLTTGRNEVRMRGESGQLEPHSGNTDSEPLA